MAHRIDAGVDAMQAPGADPLLELLLGPALLHQLLPRDAAVLAPRQL
jgi:hypothetical protein